MINQLIAGMTSLMSSPFTAMSPFCAAQSYAPLTAKWLATNHGNHENHGGHESDETNTDAGSKK